MKKSLQTAFQTRQYMISKDFEIYYYNDYNLKKVDIHTHNYYEFYFFLEGDVSIQVGDTVYPVSPGDLMLIPPYLPHRALIGPQQTAYRRFVFWISQEYCRYLHSLSPDYTYVTTYVESEKVYLFHNDQVAFNGIQSKVLRLIEEMQAKRFGRDTQISLCVNDLILHINRIVYNQNHPRSRSQDLALYQQIALHIEEHLDEDLSLEQLSKIFFVSKYHIAHVFKEHLGMSIHQYITKKRLAQCREAMIADSSIKEAYQAFGFGDYSSFYRAFKKEYGISPKDFKDMQTLTLK